MSYLLFVKNAWDFLSEMENKQVRINEISADLYSYLSQGACVPMTTETGLDTLRENMRVRIYCTIRTTYSNEVIVPDGGKFYTDCTATQDMARPLYDCVLLAGKSLVMRTLDCGDSLPRAIERSTIYPVGAIVSRGQVLVYATVVIDSGLKDESFFSLRNSSFKPIQSLIAYNHVESQLLSKLIIVKGESENV